ncbi:MAG: hypothetical protein AAFY59_00255 [Pseudomonadota bacterium]
MSGYSGTPLAKKLTLKDGMRVRFTGMPESVRAEIDDYGLALEEPGRAPFDALHLFSDSAETLRSFLNEGQHEIAPDGQIWVSWPKKASKVPTDITEDVVREIALPMGLVDIKVCAVDAVWSGLKLVVRKELRANWPGTLKK